jgi:aminocarboxymuconate-semialdehyde decarboxylase
MAKTPKSKRGFVIDIHAHQSDPVVGKFIREKSGRTGGGFAGDLKITKKMAAAQLAHMKFVGVRQRDVNLRLKEMDQAGIDMQLITPSPSAGCYWADGKTGLEMAARNNDTVAEMVAKHPHRFVGAGTVPLQDVKRSIKELERCVNDLKLRGVIIGSVVEGIELGDRKLWKFWAALEKLGVPVMIHPDGFTHPDRLLKFNMWNSIAQPLEEALAMSSFIFEGVMDAFPKIKILVCHGGGYLPYYAGRADMTYLCRATSRGKATRKPSDYMPRFYYDTVFFNPDMLQFLVQKVGDGKIMMGTDYPHHLGHWDPVDFVRKAPGLSKAAKDNILHKNAAKLFKIAL